MATHDSVGIGAAARLIGVSASRLRALTDEGVVSATLTTGGHRRYDPALLWQEWQAYRDRRSRAVPRWQRAYPLEALAEDRVWRQVREVIERDLGELPPRVRTILGYAVSEMVNNAIEHSGGGQVSVGCWVEDRMVVVSIADDGVGAFRRMADTFGWPEPAAAVVEITKGKRTTAPAGHSGEGIFFTSKAVDVFELAANGYRVVFDNVIGDVGVGEAAGNGTTVVLKLSLDTGRDLTAVFAEFTNDGVFDRTIPRIQLIAREGEFISRSEARRFAIGLEKFRRVVLDFAGVSTVGQGFVDELFRVWARTHPDVSLDVVGANPAVALMINRVARE